MCTKFLTWVSFGFLLRLYITALKYEVVFSLFAFVSTQLAEFLNKCRLSCFFLVKLSLLVVIIQGSCISLDLYKKYKYER